MATNVTLRDVVEAYYIHQKSETIGAAVRHLRASMNELNNLSDHPPFEEARNASTDVEKALDELPTDEERRQKTDQALQSIQGITQSDIDQMKRKAEDKYQFDALRWAEQVNR
jgi:hypothetical protein